MNNLINFKVLTPSETLLDLKAKKVIVKGLEGGFGMLPKHMDYISSIIPSILSYVDEQDKTHLLAVNEGTLVKCGQNITVSVLGATLGTNMEELQKAVLDSYQVFNEDEREARTALTKLEYYVFDQLMNG
jgi:F-type H+-transporting ATPase subunit epsilon